MILVAVVGLFILGLALQKENMMKYNTALKVIDIIMMLLVVIYLITRGPYFYPLAIMMIIRSIYNIAPLYLVWGEDFKYTMTQFKNMYTVNRIKPLFDKRGGVFIANHASGCFNDFIASCALGSENRLLVVNQGPLGAKGIPQDSNEYLCTLDRSNGKSGYQAMRNLIRKHIMSGDKSLIVFSEDLTKKSSKWSMAPIRSGIVKLCWEMNIPIYGMWIDWPCQFPITFRNDDRRLDVSEWIIHGSPGDFESHEELLLHVNNNFNKYINC